MYDIAVHRSSPWVSDHLINSSLGREPVECLRQLKLTRLPTHVLKGRNIKTTRLSLRLLQVLAHWEITCLKGEAAIYSSRLLSLSSHVGAHLWHEGLAGGLSGIRTRNLSTLVCLEVQALPLSHLLLLLLLLHGIYLQILDFCMTQTQRRLWTISGMRHPSIRGWTTATTAQILISNGECIL